MMKRYAVKYEVVKLKELSNEDLVKEYLSANKTYVDLTKNANILDLQSISNFSIAKDHLKRIRKEMKSRGIEVSKGYTSRNF